MRRRLAPGFRNCAVPSPNLSPDLCAVLARSLGCLANRVRPSLAWEVKHIEKAHERITAEGIEVTPIQKGVKEKTLVATIKSHNHNVPTLIIQHLD